MNESRTQHYRGYVILITVQQHERGCLVSASIVQEAKGAVRNPSPLQSWVGHEQGELLEVADRAQARACRLIDATVDHVAYAAG
ncbi:hypothetical protein P3W85_41685 [Cupriavidus basilensis]|uniref:Transposase n=1 Tax=Cupriavidus basilensis TaxID=68895 RepID=A0ABT6B3E0_9BURK|nr:hypothetical protein [Cupriavidus basilensis]MDF3839407.1 hypothetical protein [Cupriavidus basilensis]